MTNIQECLKDIDLWMTTNKLKLNKDKTELIYFYSKYLPQNSFPPLYFGGDVIHPSQSVTDIGVTFDSTLSVAPHVNSSCKGAFHHLRSIARIRNYVSVKTTDILVHAFFTSKFDFCNSLLYGVPKSLLQKLQSVQNVAARLETCTRKYDHVRPLLKDLHWLPIAERMKFKILI